MTFQKYMERLARIRGVSKYDLYRVLEGNVCTDTPDTLRKLYKMEVDTQDTQYAQYDGFMDHLAREVIDVARMSPSDSETFNKMHSLRSDIYFFFISTNYHNTKLKQTFNMSVKDFITYLEQVNEWVNSSKDKTNDIEEVKEAGDIDINIYPDREKMDQLNDWLGSIAI